MNRCCGFYSPVAKTKLVFDITNESRMYGYIKLMLNDIFLFEWISCFMFYIQLLLSVQMKKWQHFHLNAATFLYGHEIEK